MSEPVTRREWMGGCLAGGLLVGAGEVSRGSADRGELTLRVKETAGLRRFGYPVHVDLPPQVQGSRFRLERETKPIPAQFRSATGPDGGRRVALDFNTSPGPLATETYVVKWGDAIEAGPEPTRGMSVRREGDDYVVTSGGGSLIYRVPADLRWINRSVVNAQLEFIDARRPDAGGLSVLGVGGDRYANFGDSRRVESSITRQGPFAIGLRFEETVKLPDGPAVPARVDLSFPSSKSWFELVLRLDDPGGRVQGITLHLPLVVEGAPTLVDIGASNTVYGFIRGEERMVLVAGREPVGTPTADPTAAWVVYKGTDREVIPQFARSTDATGPSAEGWAHVMDRQRCTAVALDGFGKTCRDQLTVRADGTVEVHRRFLGQAPSGTAAPKGTKVLRFWAHYVTNPVQVGAVTSPQAMLAPLVAAW